MSWSADGSAGGGGRARVARTHSAAVTDWLGRTSSVGLPSSTRAGGVYVPDAGQARLVLTLTGWRRRALFGLLLTLTVIVIINLSLTLWLLRSMQFSLVRSNSKCPAPNHHVTRLFLWEKEKSYSVRRVGHQCRILWCLVDRIPVKKEEEKKKKKKKLDYSEGRSIPIESL